jgi:hypothetical protein
MIAPLRDEDAAGSSGLLSALSSPMIIPVAGGFFRGSMGDTRPQRSAHGFSLKYHEIAGLASFAPHRVRLATDRT